MGREGAGRPTKEEGEWEGRGTGAGGKRWGEVKRGKEGGGEKEEKQEAGEKGT